MVLLKPLLGCIRLGNLDLDLKIRISGLQSNAKSENGFQRWDICSWIFIFTVGLGNPKKDLKTVLKNSGLARARLLSKKKNTVHENSFANPFSDFAIERWKGNPWNPDLDFLIEIHPEDGFLRGEICFRISRSVAKSEIQISKSKSVFPNRTQP